MNTDLYIIKFFLYFYLLGFALSTLFIKFCVPIGNYAMTFKHGLMKWGIYSLYMATGLLTVYLSLFTVFARLDEVVATKCCNPAFMVLIGMAGIFGGGIVPSHQFVRARAGDIPNIVAFVIVSLILSIPSAVIIGSIIVILPTLGMDIAGLDQEGFYNMEQVLSVLVLAVLFLLLPAWYRWLHRRCDLDRFLLRNK